MPENFLTTVITDMAKLRIRIDSILNRPQRDSMEKEYEAKLERLKSSVPIRFKNEIDEMIEAEIDRQQANQILPEN